MDALTKDKTDSNKALVIYSELAREKMWSRIHLIPLLQAEEDRDLVRRQWADQARERELLGKETKVYHSDRWVSWFFSFQFHDFERGSGDDLSYFVGCVRFWWGYGIQESKAFM